jgi:hypothetical protein
VEKVEKEAAFKRAETRKTNGGESTQKVDELIMLNFNNYIDFNCCNGKKKEEKRWKKRGFKARNGF